MLGRQCWCCASTTQQQPKYWCVINTFPATKAWHSTVRAAVGKMNSISARPNTQIPAKKDFGKEQRTKEVSQLGVLYGYGLILQLLLQYLYCLLLLPEMLSQVSRIIQKLWSCTEKFQRMVQHCLGVTHGSAPSRTLNSVEAKTVMFSLLPTWRVCTLCPETGWDHSSVTNHGFVREEVKTQNFCTIMRQDHSGAVL